VRRNDENTVTIPGLYCGAARHGFRQVCEELVAWLSHGLVAVAVVAMMGKG
jgi:hypothetical protein